MSVTFHSNAKQAKDAAKQAMMIGLEICGGVAESYAKRLCPVDTGNLRNSITHQQINDHTEVIGTNVEYAPYVELGHHTSSGSLVAPRPFLRPAAENHGDEYKAIILDALQNA